MLICSGLTFYPHKIVLSSKPENRKDYRFNKTSSVKPFNIFLFHKRKLQSKIFLNNFRRMKVNVK